MLAPIITASAVMVLGGALLLSAAAPAPNEDLLPAAEGLSAAQDLDDRMLEVLNEPDGYRINDLAAGVFTEDATFTMVWGPDEIDLDPDRLHITSRFFDPMTATRLGAVEELPATAEGDSRYVGIYDFEAPSGTVWPGTVCATWAREGLIYRLDCLFPEPVITEVID